MRRLLLFTVSALILSTSSFAAVEPAPREPVEKPSFKPDDMWTFRITDRNKSGETRERHYVLSIVRASSKSVVLSSKATDSSMPPIEKFLGADLSFSDSINGKSTIVHKPFDFPLKAGKKWKVSYDRENPTKNIRKHHVELEYESIGWEEITVAAGTFQAFKIEAEGNWLDEYNPTALKSEAASQIDKGGATVVVRNQRPTTPAPATGKIFRTYWYVPAIKREVKNVEELFSPSGSLASKSTWELESFMVDGKGKK